jgi:hypothetical protein
LISLKFWLHLFSWNFIIGASSDFQGATQIATAMVKKYGMSDKVNSCCINSGFMYWFRMELLNLNIILAPLFEERKKGGGIVMTHTLTSELIEFSYMVINFNTNKTITLNHCGYTLMGSTCHTDLRSKGQGHCYF